jgi:hypothetical protein
LIRSVSGLQNKWGYQFQVRGNHTDHISVFLGEFSANHFGSSWLAMSQDKSVDYRQAASRYVKKITCLASSVSESWQVFWGNKGFLED